MKYYIKITRKNGEISFVAKEGEKERRVVEIGCMAKTCDVRQMSLVDVVFAVVSICSNSDDIREIAIRAADDFYPQGISTEPDNT